MSHCRVCAKVMLCDWETAPKNCLDFKETVIPDIDAQVYEFLDKLCEIRVRGGARYRGTVRGVDGAYLLFQLEDKEVLAVDLDEGPQLFALSSSDTIERTRDRDTFGGF